MRLAGTGGILARNGNAAGIYQKRKLIISCWDVLDMLNSNAIVPADGQLELHDISLRLEGQAGY